MTYEVDISPDALDEYDAAYEWLLEQTPQYAPAWYNAVADALLSLAENPMRCPKVDPEGDLRYLLFGNKRHAYRIIFRIRGSTVCVYSIRHSSRQL
jgi:plasmid stabilization system protein ParE